MKIIRIEHEDDGLGFFRSDTEDGEQRSIKHSNYAIIWERHNNRHKFPDYYNDDKLRNQVDSDFENIEEYNFAFLSLDQFNEAFTKEEVKECIINLGFRVLMYDVDKDYYQSDYQVIFIKSSVNSVENISSLFL